MISKSNNENKKNCYLSNNNIKYKFIIEKANNHVSIKQENYIKLIYDSNLKDYKFLNINNLNEIFNFLLNKFQTNKTKIKEIHKNINIKLEINPNIFLVLLYKTSINKNLVISNPKNRIISAKNNEKLNKIDNSKINSGKLKLCNTLIKDSFCILQIFGFEKIFIQVMDIFNSLDTNLPYIIYISNITNIIFYNFMNNEITSSIKEAHGFAQIIHIRHYLYDKKDIILSASSESIKLWKFKTLECFEEIKKNNYNNLIFARLFKDKSRYFIAVAHQLRNLRIFDMDGKQIKEIQKSVHIPKDITREEYNNYVNGLYFMDIYFDKQSSKNYILSCGVGFLKSYDVDQGKLFKNYVKANYGNNINNTYYHFVIYDNGIIVKLITAYSNGKIRIFNFNSSELLSEIKVDNNSKIFFHLYVCGIIIIYL